MLVQLPIWEEFTSQKLFGSPNIEQVLFQSSVFCKISPKWLPKVKIFHVCKAVLDGEVAVPCCPQSAIAGLNSRP